RAHESGCAERSTSLVPSTAGKRCSAPSTRSTASAGSCRSGRSSTCHHCPRRRPMDVDLLRSTWHHAGRFGDRFVAWFYGQLFYAHPELRDLFGVDMAGQRRKLADTLDLVV